MAAVIVIIAAVVVTAALVVWFVRSQHPEQAAGHSDEHPTTPGFEYYSHDPSGPAGADVDSQNPDDPGSRRDTPPPRG